MEDKNNHVSIDIMKAGPVKKKENVYFEIEERLDPVKPVFKRPADTSIGLVPKHLRDVNEKAYEPQIIAIGPYHRRHKTHLKLMEEHKQCYLKGLLQRKGENQLERYVKTLENMEKSARKCYTDAECLEENGFVEMLLLDACFIVELFRKDSKTIGKDNDPVFESCWMKQKLCRDLLLAENQIPFFVLKAFFQMTATQDERNDFLKMIFSFFRPLLPRPCVNEDACNDFKKAKVKIKHLLSFVHDLWVYEVVEKDDSDKVNGDNGKCFRCATLLDSDEVNGDDGKCIRCATLLDSDEVDEVNGDDGKCIRCATLLDSDEVNGDDEKRIPCATLLKETGVKFRRFEKRGIFDVWFENGKMKIPKLTIEDDTESFFRNLIVYEQLYPKESNPVVDYMNFMDSLINSAKDVELLCRHDIVDNLLGDEEVVAKMFNRLGDSVTLSSSNRYKKIYKQVNNHCRRRRCKWMAMLRHNHCNNPWTIISLLAAVLLLLLTLGQTVFSVLAYFK